MHKHLQFKEHVQFDTYRIIYQQVTCYKRLLELKECLPHLCLCLKELRWLCSVQLFGFDSLVCLKFHFKFVWLSACLEDEQPLCFNRVCLECILVGQIEVPKSMFTYHIEVPAIPFWFCLVPLRLGSIFLNVGHIDISYVYGLLPTRFFIDIIVKLLLSKKLVFQVQFRKQ